MSNGKYGPPWTPETVAAEARCYKTRREFREGADGAYDAARRRFGILDEVCHHMEPGPSKARIWDRKRVQQAVDTCQTYEEFKSHHPFAYKAVCRNGWQDLTASLPRTSTPPGWWSLERVSEEAKKYGTRTDFAKGSPSAYQAAHRKQWLDVVCAHMELKQRPNGYWTRERVIEEAKKYSSRSDFQKCSGGAYAIAASHGLLDEACAHMQKKGSQYERAVYAFEFEDRSVYVGLTFDYDVRYREHLTQNKHVGRKLKQVGARYVRFGKWFPLEEAAREEARVITEYREGGWTILNRAKPGGVGSRPRKWTLDEIKSRASKYDTVQAFAAANYSAYTTAHKHGWWGDISQHLERKLEHGKWTLDALVAEAQNYSSRKEFIEGSPSAYNAARKKRVLDEVCGHMDRLVHPVGYWTKDKVFEEAQRYQTRVAFQKGASSAYNKAYKEGWLEEVTGHMEEIKKPTGYWTIERIKSEAKKYQTRSEFQKNAVSAYNRAHKSGWLDEVCEHMERLRKSNGYWTKERILDESSKYRTLKEFRDGSHGAYDSAYDMGLMEELHRRMQMDKKPNGYWTFERVAEEARNYATRTEFQRGASSAYSKASKMGWLDDICSHMGHTKNDRFD